jgi:hypothetical protein
MHEMKLHINYCKEFGISEEEMLASEEKQGKLPLVPSRQRYPGQLTRSK